MPESVEACPLCDSQEYRLFDQRTFRGLPVTNLICKHCGFVYQSPRMTESELSIFYKVEYRRLYQGADAPDDKDLRVQAGRAEALLRFCDGHLPAIKRFLDIGCSAGLLLQRFKEAYGCRVAGVEPGELYRDYARSQRLRVFATLEELRAKDKKRFDLISLAHVLEHLPDPASYLDELREGLLTKAGWLLVEVPNLYAHECFEVAHLVSYSEHTLRQVLGKAGFEVVALQAHGQPRSRLLTLYLTALARPQDSPEAFQARAESGVHLKRWWGMARRRLLERVAPWLAWQRIK